jgi:hypothetical protein
MTISLIIVAAIVVARVGWRLYRTRRNRAEGVENRWR